MKKKKKKKSINEKLNKMKKLIKKVTKDESNKIEGNKIIIYIVEGILELIVKNN